MFSLPDNLCEICPVTRHVSRVCSHGGGGGGVGGGGGGGEDEGGRGE